MRIDWCDPVCGVEPSSVMCDLKVVCFGNIDKLANVPVTAFLCEQTATVVYDLITSYHGRYVSA